MSTTQIIDGKAVAAAIRSELKERVSAMTTKPGLAVVQVGDRPDSSTYVRMKHKACEEMGIMSIGHKLPLETTEEDLVKLIVDLNSDSEVHGILVQLPLPDHISAQKVLNEISAEKDVDGLTWQNVAKLADTSRKLIVKGNQEVKLDYTNLESIPFHMPCTPLGCIELLDRSNIPIEGKNAVVVGRSNLVGMPVSLLLLHRNASVTIVHSRTKDIASAVQNADIVIAAVGKAQLVKKEWIKEGAVVIDVGINSIDDPNAKRGYRLVGDVDYQDCFDKASAITPVPGGVGPMTIAMLLRNTVLGAVRATTN